MLYVVIYSDPHSGYDYVKGVASTPEAAHDILKDAFRLRYSCDAECHKWDWSIWAYTLLIEFLYPVYKNHARGPFLKNEMPQLDPLFGTF